MGTTIFALLAFVWAFIVNKGELHTFYKKGTAEEGKSFVALCVTSSWLAYYIVDEKFFTAIIVGCIRFHIGSHYEAKDICKIQILKKEKTVLGL